MAKRKRLVPASVTPSAEADSSASLSRSSVPPIARVVADASAQSALAEVSGVLERARHEGRLVLTLPLDVIDHDYLLRDRMTLDPEELSSLKLSLATHGQRTPIEVVETKEGRYGLISGWRRLMALREMTLGDDRFSTIQALLRRPHDISDAYIAMIEENEIRQGLSYYERARITARAVDRRIFATQKEALGQLFGAASRAKRSKIGSFIRIFRQLDYNLRFPTYISERLGLALAKIIEEQGSVINHLKHRLLGENILNAEDELRILQEFIANTPTTPPKDVTRADVDALFAKEDDTFNHDIKDKSLTSSDIVLDKNDKKGPKPHKKEITKDIFVEMVESAQGVEVKVSGKKVNNNFYHDLVLWLQETNRSSI